MESTQFNTTHDAIEPAIVPPSQPIKTKRGVKRKADTTTPVVSSSPYDPVFDPSPKVEKLVSPKVTPAKVLSAKVLPAKVLPAKVTPARRESNRQIKKPKRDLPSEEPVGEQVNFNFKMVLTIRQISVHFFIKTCYCPPTLV
ncbi:bromodomain-containing protein 2-like [Mizuhopecten yessoensis]|uniref:bromodomain-containing protein 2-like n=1 Tax=Mizuhopecten yessoensis TaxID=6573 RepID=UPI000B45EC92|nr:bromodomain-containing protein 2-like [Mizuhopecten yessoensis]